MWSKIFEQSVEQAAAAPMAYVFFVIETRDEIHINALKAQLGVK
jgi:macrolide phosphotransferase